MEISESALQKLRNGEVIAVPTDTVYGLVASIQYPFAIEQIFTLKNRPKQKPLILFVSNQQQMIPFVDHLPPHAKILITQF